MPPMINNFFFYQTTRMSPPCPQVNRRRLGSKRNLAYFEGGFSVRGAGRGHGCIGSVGVRGESDTRAIHIASTPHPKGQEGAP